MLKTFPSVFFHLTRKYNRNNNLNITKNFKQIHNVASDRYWQKVNLSSKFNVLDVITSLSLSIMEHKELIN